MSEVDDNSDLFTISTVPGEVVSEQTTADQEQNAALGSANTSKASTAASAPKGKNKNKRTRKASKAGKAIVSEQEAEDIKLHVEAGWSDDEKDDKDHPSKRIAAGGESGSPVAVKKTNSHLESFTVRAVVTRKDVDLIFEAEAGTKESIEQQTATSITIVAGKDDPEIVVDRVLSVKGHIDDVSATYRIIAEGLLKIKQKAAAASAKKTTNAAAPDDAAADAAADAEDDDPTNGGGVASANAENDGEHSEHQEDDDESVAGVENESHAGEPAAAEDATMTAGGADAKVAPVDKKAKESAQKESAAKRVTLRMLVPHKCVGSIMGHGGKTINNIRDAASVNIHTSESTLPLSSERIVEIVGAPESIEKAIRLVAEALTKDIASYTSAEHYVPAANLPSAMTVETQSRKRKDNKRQGIHNDNRGGNKGYHQGNRGGGFRSSNQGGYGGNNRQHGNAANNPKSASVHNNGNRSSGTASYGGGRNDRYGRQNDRQSGRGHGPLPMSYSNRIPAGGNGGVPQGQYNNGGGYRAGNQQGGPRQSVMHGHVGGAAMGYNGGYAMPAANTYSGYAGQGAAVGGGNGSRYGSGAAAVGGPVHAVGAYGTGGYSAPSAAYQFPTPVSYAYAPAPMQDMFNNRPAQPANNAYPARSYAPHGGRAQQMPQPSMAVGAPTIRPGMGGGSVGEAAGQAIQQMYVSSDKIGAIIGRRGETINEIRRSTNARVEIQDSAQGAKKRLILITGAYEQVRSAYHIINEKLEAARQSGRI